MSSATGWLCEPQQVSSLSFPTCKMGIIVIIIVVLSSSLLGLLGRFNELTYAKHLKHGVTYSKHCVSGQHSKSPNLS